MTTLGALAWVAGLIVLTAVLGLVWRARQGRVRAEQGAVVTAAEVFSAAPFGPQATLLQFSTEFCARCPATRRLLGTIADAHSGVVHVDVDLTHRPELARRFNVLQTPTTLILDSTGRVRARIGGPPNRADVTDHLSRLTSPVQGTVAPDHSIICSTTHSTTH